MATTEQSTSEKKARAGLAHPPVIVDLGQKTKQRIERMKQGEGPLYDAVCETVEVLQEDGVVGKNAQVVIVVVEKLPNGVVIPNLFSN